MGKSVFRSAVFLGILVLLLIGSSFLLRPKDNTAESGIHDILANGILSEPKDTIDVVLLGDSLVHTSFIPMRLWEQWGITSHNCASNSQTLIKTEEFLESVFQNQRPKLIMLEANHIFREFDTVDVIGPAAERILPVFRYHNRWKSLEKADFITPVQYSADIYEKGYYYTGEIQPADPGDYMTGPGWSEPVPEICIVYLRQMDALCRRNGAELVLYSVPSPDNWNNARHQVTEELARMLGISYLDTNLCLEEIGIDWNLDTKDAGDHMNYTGACKVTDYLGDWFESRGIFTDKRADADYQHWNRQLQRFQNWLDSALAG